LALTAGEMTTAFADDRVVALGEARNEIVSAGRPCSRNHLIFGQVPQPEGDIVADRPVEKDGVLGHQADAFAQVSDAEIA
jgi:hypothetical protein